MKLKLLDQNGNKVWGTKISIPEYELIKTITNHELTNTSLLAQILTPVRTHSATYLALDLFSPIFGNTIYYGITPDKQNCAYYCGMASIAMFDLMTVPVRLLTLIPRVIYNSTQPEHPFRTWLSQHKAPVEYIMQDRITVQVTGRIQKRKEDEGKKSRPHSHSFFNVFHERPVNFIAPHKLLNSYPGAESNINEEEYEDVTSDKSLKR